MKSKNSPRNIIIIILLLVPLLSIGMNNPTTEFSVWIVNSDSHDVSTNIAIGTLLEEVASTKLNIKETTLDRLELVPLHVDILVLVGHGQIEGLKTPKALIPWSELYTDISAYQPQKTIVLACNSPSDQSSNIIGFDGSVDAEAGAIMAGWYIQQAITQQGDTVFPFERIAQAQETMKYPLGRYLYLVHGYWGFNNQFLSMATDFKAREDFKLEYGDDANVEYFSYFEGYPHSTESEMNSIHTIYTISDFANNLYNELSNLPSGSQVNFIAHSMGGIIVREMLSLHRSDLNDDGISIGTVITLGTPHGGTHLANPYHPWASILALIGGYLGEHGHLWPSLVFWSMAPTSLFMLALNSNPLAYSYDIDWYTIYGYDAPGSALMFPIHLDWSDPIVARGMSHLSFEQDWRQFSVSHLDLIAGDQAYDILTTWITSGADSDGDGLTDAAEIYQHQTSPTDWDTDGDGINDGSEVIWEYDPLDSSSPIPASSLISSVSYTSSTRNVRVYVTHFTNMDYVKFYVKYKTKYSWTSYSYMGTDYSPSSGKYYDSWTHPTGYIQMTIKVNAYDSDGHYIGTDYYTRYISDGGGGGGGGGRPPIE